MASTTVSYSGLGANSPILHFVGKMRRGCRASAFLLYLPPATHTITGGNLSLVDTASGASFSLQDCLPGQSHRSRSEHRCDDDYVIATIYDRRKHWERQGGSAEFNRRDTRGNILHNQKNCRQVVQALLDMMGETGYDASVVSDAFYPYVRFDGPPVLALEKLLARTGYDLVLKTDNTVEIVQLGSGSDRNTGAGYLESLGGTSNDGPQQITLVGGPSIWHNFFELEAIGEEAETDLEVINSLSYKPTAGWEKEDPRLWAGVDATYRHLAHKTVLRWHRITTLTGGSPGNYEPTGASEAGTSIDQLLPLLSSNGQYTPHTSWWTPEPSRLQGKFYPHTDHPYNTNACTDYEGGFDLDLDRGIVKTDQPVWQYGSSDGDINEPNLQLYAAHRFRNSDGIYDRYTRDKALTGTGPAVELPFPEIFLARYWLTPACIPPATGDDNETEIESEADAILTSWGTAISESVPRRMRDMIGIHAVDCDGVVSAVEWTCGTRRLPGTKITLGSLEDVMSRLMDSGGTVA